jgi:hypothetical protein
VATRAYVVRWLTEASLGFGSLDRLGKLYNQYMMQPGLVAIIASAVAGLLTLAGVWISAAAATRREKTVFSRTSARERVETLSGLFERALIVLERHAKNFGKASEADSAEITQTKARLTLRAPATIVDQFETAARVLDDWAAEARQGSPRPGPNGVTIITSGFSEKKHNERAEALWPQFEAARSELVERMRRVIESEEETLR